MQYLQTALKRMLIDLPTLDEELRNCGYDLVDFFACSYHLIDKFAILLSTLERIRCILDLAHLSSSGVSASSLNIHVVTVQMKSSRLSSQNLHEVLARRP